MEKSHDSGHLAIFSKLRPSLVVNLFDLFGFFAVNLLDDLILFLFLQTLLEKEIEILDEGVDGFSVLVVLHGSLGIICSLN